MQQVYAAVDLGAGSGRVMAGILEGQRIRLVEVHRFDNVPVVLDGHLHWDVDRLWQQVLTGLRMLLQRWPGATSIGIDTWAVDYGLLDRYGELLGPPYCYRDDRTEAVVPEVHAAITPERLYRITGLQFLPFNTVYQLAAEQRSERWARARSLLLLPDLLAHRLTGVAVAEVTNASTTGLLDATTRTWSDEVLAAVGVDRGLLPDLVEPGTTIGAVRPELGLPPVPVVAVGSHDTASAVVGVPAGEHFGYISSGTWSLVGVELDAPVLTEASRRANFTNEGGVDATVRYLRNVGGLWLLEQCRQEWGDTVGDLPELVAAAAELPSGGPLLDVDSADLIAPGDMVRRITAAAPGGLPDDPVTITRCILDSLADAYARTISQAEGLAGRVVETVHLVGGGAHNRLLCQLTADASRRPVVAGPTEATALGNVVVQARASGALTGGLPDLRRIVATSAASTRFEPLR